MTSLIAAALSGVDFIALRYETPLTPCTGITAVVRQELRAFRNRGLILAPWSGRMNAAKQALASGGVVDSGFSFTMHDPSGATAAVRVLVAHLAESAPVFYLQADGRFEGIESPYDTDRLRDDAVFFGRAVRELLRGRVGDAFIWGADWETVPALALCPTRVSALTLHNTFDTRLDMEIGMSPEPELQRFRQSTVLQAALDFCDVVTTVNRGYSQGLRSEVFHRLVMADHLQSGVHRIVGIDNANFVDPTSEQIDLAEVLEHDVTAGLATLRELQVAALRQLPERIARLARGKTFCISMGRRSAQKMHCAVVEAVRAVLRTEPELPLFVFFATTHADKGSAARLQRIQALCDEFPENTHFSDGRIDYFSALMAAASFNILCSLWAPHEGAFEATVVPIARAIDGLAAQVCPPDRAGECGRLADLWHAPGAGANGLTFRERSGDESQDRLDLAALLNQSPAPQNPFFVRLTETLARTLREAVSMHMDQPESYGRLVQGCIRTQQHRSWDINLGGMLALVTQARSRAD